MLLKNISSEAIGIVNSDNIDIVLQPGKISSVSDIKGKGYLANYPNIFKFVEKALADEIEKVKEIEEVKIDTESTIESEPEQIIETPEIESIPEIQEENTETEGELDLGEDTEIESESIESIRDLYKEKFGTDVPNNKKNDLEWIKNKINS